MNAGFTALFHYRNSQAPIYHFPRECLTHLLMRFVFVGGVVLLRWCQPAEGRAKESPCRGMGLCSGCSQGQGCREFLLSLVQQLFIYFYRTTVSAFCSLLVWLVMSPFSLQYLFFPFLLIEVLTLTSCCIDPIPKILLRNSYFFPTKSPLFSEGSAFLPGLWTAVLFKTSPPE